jgi:hypothetical protein
MQITRPQISRFNQIYWPIATVFLASMVYLGITNESKSRPETTVSLDDHFWDKSATLHYSMENPVDQKWVETIKIEGERGQYLLTFTALDQESIQRARAMVEGCGITHESVIGNTHTLELSQTGEGCVKSAYEHLINR